MGLSRENEFILSVLKSYLGRQAAGIGNGLNRQRLDWNKVIAVATAQDLLPLLYHVLSQQEGMGRVPSPQRNEIEEGFLASTASTLLYDNLLKEVVASFDQEACPFILLKGLSLALEFYRPREVRHYRDLDILIRAEDFERVKAFLLKLGFEITQPERETARRRFFNSLGFFKPGIAEVHLDLHWETLMVSWNRRPFLSDSKVWEEIRWLEGPGIRLPVLQPPRLLLYLCLHFAFHHQFGKLLTLCDLDLVIQKFGENMDWDQIVWQCREMMIRKPVYYSLMLGASVLGTPVPQSVLKVLSAWGVGANSPLFHRLVFREKPLSTNVERGIKFLLIDGFAGKIQAVLTFLKQR